MSAQLCVDFESLFLQRPERVAFPLKSDRQLLQGVCWFGESSLLPSYTNAMAEFLGIFGEEVPSTVDLGSSSYVQEVFIPSLKKAEQEIFQKTEGAVTVGFNSDNDITCQDLLYISFFKEQDMLVSGRSKEKHFGQTLRNIQELAWALPLFSTPPNLIASGKDLSGWNSLAGLKAHCTPTPWQVKILNANTIEELSKKIDTFMTLVGCPERLWALFMQKDDENSAGGIFRVSAHPIIQAGRRKLPVPEQAFSLTRKRPKIASTGSTFSVYFFWPLP